MSVSTDAPQIEARGKVLKFPVNPAPTRPKWPGLERHAFAVALISVLLVAAIGATLWAVRVNGAVRYVTVPAGHGAMSRGVTATGTVNPVRTVIIGTHVSGVIEDFYCDYNTQVRAGELCAKIDPRPYQAILDQYGSQLLRDRAILAKDLRDLERYRQLAVQNSVARQQSDDQGYVVRQDEATVKLDETLLEGAKLNLGYTDIVSPVDGTVMSRSVTGGQTVAASDQAPALFVVATDLKRMEVDTSTSEADMGGIKEGDKATFTVDAFPQRAFQGTVTQIRRSPHTVHNVVTYDVVVGIDNSDGALMPGMTALTRIVTDERSDVLRVPDQALRYVPGGPPAGRDTVAAAGESRVFVLREGEPVAVSVVTGLDDGSFSEILSGALRPGDDLILAETVANAAGQPAIPPARF